MLASGTEYEEKLQKLEKMRREKRKRDMSPSGKNESVKPKKKPMEQKFLK